MTKVFPESPTSGPPSTLPIAPPRISSSATPLAQIPRSSPLQWVVTRPCRYYIWPPGPVTFRHCPHLSPQSVNLVKMFSIGARTTWGILLIWTKLVKIRFLLIPEILIQQAWGRIREFSTSTLENSYSSSHPGTLLANYWFGPRPILLKFMDQDSGASSIHVTHMDTETQWIPSVWDLSHCLTLSYGARKGRELDFQIDMPQPGIISGVSGHHEIFKLGHTWKWPGVGG